MNRQWKTVAGSPIVRVAMLSAVLSAIVCLIVWDSSRVNRDFQHLKALLRDARLQTAGKDKTLIAKFAENNVSIIDGDSGGVLSILTLPTLHQVNYDTSLGKNMIVFYARGTGKFNKRIHGGDIRLKSWLGFRKNIAVNCTALVSEGTYPVEKDQG